MKKNIQHVTILGSGIMGSRIACHFANIGVNVLLLDMVPRELSEEESRAGLTAESPKFRNRIVNQSLETAIKSNPAPLYHKKFASLIKTGNFDDDLPKIANTDWIMEVVVENLKIKQSLFEKVEQYRKPGTLITSNTSGIPIKMMSDGRSQDFRENFCGTHFFNPPRYLALFEVIPGPETKADILEFLMEYGKSKLGKTAVLAKDTPAFIANRVGVFGIMALFNILDKVDLPIEAIDKLTGPLIGRPKSATFRTCDVVGIDTLVKVAQGVAENCPSDESIALFQLPDFLKTMVENNWLGDKSGQGFYKKGKSAEGKKEILALNLKTMEYQAQEKVKFPLLDQIKQEDNLKKRLKMLIQSPDKAGEFFRMSYAYLFRYVSHRIPEIADELYRIDDGMVAGFGWEIGPFESWDAIGLTDMNNLMKLYGLPAASWVDDMLAEGHNSFYKVEDGKRLYYDIPSKSYKIIPGSEKLIVLDTIRKSNVVWKNSGSSLFDMGDGVLNLEFHTKMNAIGSEIIAGFNKAVDVAEKDYRGLVVGNNAATFSAGANLGMVFMLAVEQEYDELDFAIRAFQKFTMRARYSSVPVVVAPHGLTLGGGCELSLHADGIQAAAETYMGLVEVGVGVIPGGGGTKEMALRVSDMLETGDVEFNSLQNAFMNIATAKVATSAYEAFDLGYLRRGDRVSIHLPSQLADAKRFAIDLAEAGYIQPQVRTDVKVQGKGGMALFMAGINGMRMANYISDHDQKIANKLAYVICGGDLSYPQLVSEQYLLDLEREAFLSLLGEKKTLERIQSVLKSGKPLRN
jgi:3-hydroxyacyl-CoA dehydrogenase